MIISASRRTDIPSFYSSWFLNRVSEGFVDVRNPMYPKQVSRYSLSPEIVDGIVFWTKNPKPMLNKLNLLEEYEYYFQFSLTSYGKDIEEHLPNKWDLIETFKRLSDQIGPERIMWRYDPILLSEKYTFDYQVQAFQKIAQELKGYTNKATISFLDEYTFGGRSIYKELGVEEFTPELMNKMAEQLSLIADDNNLVVDTCAEKINLQAYKIEHSRCVDSRVFEKLSGHKLSRLKTKYEELGKDKSQRTECGCIESIDIGAPNTCFNGCRYCYAIPSVQALSANRKLHDPKGTMLLGKLDEASGDRLTDHRGKGSSRDRSFKYVENEQKTLFDKLNSNETMYE